MCWPDPFCARGRFVTLVPLSQDHAPDLSEAAEDGQVYRLWYAGAPHPNGVPAEIDRCLALKKDGAMLPFAVLGTNSGKAVGMTSFLNIDALNRRMEIGETWYRRAVQRSPFNTECKMMLLRHAFEELNCIAVEMRSHFMNHPARKAIERLGAKLDGVLRAHQLMEDGALRDTAVYSITAPEWLSVKANLEWLLEKPR